MGDVAVHGAAAGVSAGGRGGAASGGVVSEGPWTGLLAGYRDYLVQERGLASLTVAGYERVARLFLEQQPAGLGLSG